MYNEILHHPNNKLKSRHLIWSEVIDTGNHERILERAKEDFGVKKSFIIVDPNTKPPDCNMPRPNLDYTETDLE